MIKADYIWFNGKLVKWEEAQIHVLTHTLHYGLGVFEGIRCYNTAKGPAIFRHHEHIERLFKSAHIVYMKIPYTMEEIRQATFETIKANNLKECYIRPIAFYGTGAMGLNPLNNEVNVAIICWEWGAYLGEEGMKKGIRCKISSFNRHHVNVSMTKAKVCGNYVNSQLAKIEAILDGYDEALMLDVDGTVAEGSGENIFIVRKGIIKTPPSLGILEGITRDSVITIAKDLGLEVREEKISRDEVYIADEMFLCGTAAEITPVREVDRRTIGEGKPGPITRKLQEVFFKVVRGEDPKYQHWLDYVE
ncbi:branched-chain amino acid aminotransferase [Thermosulfidibacter takaii ABI70S6]|uniref:Branched-chain-amino-acid aminotransferase n=1 Tax=Thermosulfidibacter takaii (strain DSM 17441 / JCM 13301 / NBRC 103674 / ABI70S6) TaxID=1298851 RepID=A0A0S3QUF3_THET7|nr:branched-chain amino acid transaminase [Thermosulfidibacter takaii]BAT71965.1 branched-chain amino acid aminotransferase [Thermosulfidibacter takaii ABI70S6]